MATPHEYASTTGVVDSGERSVLIDAGDALRMFIISQALTRSADCTFK